MTSLLAIHDLGAAGGRPWAEAFATWPGPVTAPDLPGHGTAPAPVSGHYEVGDAVFAIVDHLRDPGEEQPVVLGVGHSGHAAGVLAVAGRATALVLVDGLGGPWLDVAERNDAQRTVRRRILDTPAALGPHVAGSTDPRASLVLGPTDRDHMVELCSAIGVPTLAVETPESRTPDAEEIVRAIEDAALVRLDSDEPFSVAEHVTRWWSDRSP